jgi:hypothetical protein
MMAMIILQMSEKVKGILILICSFKKLFLGFICDQSWISAVTGEEFNKAYYIDTYITACHSYKSMYNTQSACTSLNVKKK